MQVESTTPSRPLTIANGVLVLAGYGVRVAVERGHLTASDGAGRDRRHGRFSRTARLRRLVVLGHTGTISFEALRWLTDVGAAIVQIDADGRVIVASGPAGLDDARLRRAQALAATNGTGLAMARDLLNAKLAEQAGVLERFPDASAARALVLEAREALGQAQTVDELRSVEATAAAAYWGAWATVPVRFARRDAGRVPDHWRTFGARSSPLTGSPRSAVNPANAILNYLYAVLEAESRIACLAVGLDPGMGILHADQRARDSLALDVLEPVRPRVDRMVLDLLHAHTFAARDVFETRQGACRLMPSLTTRLAEMAPTLARLVAPVAERVAQSLAQSTMSPARRERPVPTPLTQTNRSAGREGVRRTAKRPPAAPAMRLPPTCRECGTTLTASDRQYCDGCLPACRAETIAAFSTAGPAALARLRAAGRDPAHGGDAGRKRGERNAAHNRAAAAWADRQTAEADPDVFYRDVLPRLQGVPLRAMAEATGLTEGYCSFIRRGLAVPHRRHWEALAAIGERSTR